MNHTIFLNLYSLAHQSALLDGLYIFCAKYLPYLVIVLAIVFLLFHHEIFYRGKPFKEISKKIKEIFFVFLSVFSAWILAIFLKIIFQIPRPFTEFSNIVPLLYPKDFSFPSGHATLFMAIAVALFLYHKKIGYLFMVFAVLIGLSRIIIGVHFPLDILGGFLIGAFISYLLIRLFRK